MKIMNLNKQRDVSFCIVREFMETRSAHETLRKYDISGELSQYFV